MSKYIWVQTIIDFEQHQKIWLKKQYDKTFKTYVRFSNLHKYNTFVCRNKKEFNFDKWFKKYKQFDIVVNKKNAIYKYITKIYLGDLLS